MPRLAPSGNGALAASVGLGMTELLAPATAMGAVTLRVADLDAMTAFYKDAIGLTVLSASVDTVSLGRSSGPVVVLEHSPALKHASPRDAGLFHTAILFDTEAALAAAIASVAQRYPGSFTGSADHLVSTAFDFNDPENNGVELYWDRDRSQWSWVHGSIEMASLYLDPNAFLAEHLSDTASVGDARVGHVHLQVGDVATAQSFYVDTLGFSTTAAIGSTAFCVSAGGYHHHMAMNTWNSAGAGPRQLALGLARVEIAVPSDDDLGALSERLAHYGVQQRDDGAAVSFDDPWGSVIRVAAG